MTAVDPGGATALRELQRSVVGRATMAAVLQALATITEIVPIIAAVEVARRLLSGEVAGVWTIVVIAIVLLAVRAVLYVAAAGISHLADADLSATLRTRVADRLERLPLGWFAGGVTGRVSGVVERDVAQLHHAVAHNRGDVASAIVGPLAIIGYLTWVDWRLAIITVALVAVAQSIRMRLAGRASEPGRRIAAANSELLAASVEAVQNADVLKAFGDARAPARFAAAASDYIEADAETQRLFVRLRSLTRATVAPATVGLVLSAAAVGGVAIGWTRPTAIIAFVLLGVGLFEQLTPIYTAIGERRQARASAGRINDLLSEPTTIEVDPADALTPHPPLTVEFDAVGFGYRAGTPVVDGIDAVLQPGTMTALVGPSGAGKSTLASLLARFYDVTDGAIRIGGADLRDLTRTDLYRSIGFLFQDVTLLRRSVRDNLTLGLPACSEDDLAVACRAAAIHDRIVALPRGFDSVVGDDAILSGGERQRLAIARTLLRNTPVLVLDEATAYADPESEAAIQQALSRLAVGRTVLVIAHRLHTIRGADQILVLDQGRVVERGTHTDLLAARGRYAALWDAQQGDRS